MNLPVICHVEVGGSYGGSLRALELYLRHCDRSRFEHDLLFYYSTPGMERLCPLVRQMRVLQPHAPLAHRRGRWPARRPHLPHEDVVRLVARLPRSRRLAQILHHSGCAAVHCNNSFPYQAPTLVAARGLGLPLAAHVRNPLRGTACDRWLARQARLLFVLHGLQEDQLRGWNLDADIVRCPDGVELPAAHAARAARWRRQCLAGGTLLLGAMGRLTAQKGFLDLLAAAALVLPNFPGARLAIFGEGDQRPELERAVVAHGLQDRVLLAGFDPGAASLLAALDLFICSSRWEGLPLAVLEALLAGVPVVATEGALRGDPRLYRFLAAPPASPGPQGLAAALSDALTHAPHAARAAAAGRAWVEAEFSPTAAAKRLDASFERLDCRAPRGQAFYECAYEQANWQRDAAEGGAGARFTKMWYRRALETVLPGLALEGRRVLEIGAGYGYLAPFFAAAGARYTGIDLAASALRQFPRGLGRCAPVQADGCNLPFAAAAFDLIVCMEVFEHIPDGGALLAEIARVAAPGALLLLSAPNYCNAFLPFKILADCGSPLCRRLLKRQPVDHTLFAFRMRRLLARQGTVLRQLAVRLHPPLFEHLDYRFGPGRGPARINDLLFALERRWGGQFPLRNFGLHTCFLLQLRQPDAQRSTAPCTPPATPARNSFASYVRLRTQGAVRQLQAGK
ncbi:MAG: glycosyltransferase [Terriglobales bacterium]